MTAQTGPDETFDDLFTLEVTRVNKLRPPHLS